MAKGTEFITKEQLKFFHDSFIRGESTDEEVKRDENGNCVERYVFINELMEKFDKNNDDKIDREEFKQVMRE